MNKYMFIFVALLMLAACSNIGTKDSNLDFSGVWQFPNRGVWLQINPDGKAYQCRIDRNGSVISSVGELRTNSSIYWLKVWQPDEVRREKNTLYLKGMHGDFGFEKAHDKMMDKCKNPI